MSSGQSMLVLGAMILFELISLRFSSNLLENSTSETENKFYQTAFSLADALIEEIKEKIFGGKTIDFLTIIASLSLLKFFIIK